MGNTETGHEPTQKIWKPTGTSDYAFDANLSYGPSDYTRDSDSNRCSVRFE